MASPQQDIDARNADFWDELCGSSLARGLGIAEVTPESLERFDAAYLGMYPYLDRYLPGRPARSGESLLEIGLGFGTVGQQLAERGYRYSGVDIASGPVEMMRDRLQRAGEGDAQVASALDLPFEDASFDHVVSIGCLHHTGDIPASVAEVHRVLRPGGRALVMLYNSRSWRQLTRLRPAEVLRRLRGGSDGANVRAAYDTNEAGDAAPMSEFVSRREVKRLFGRFSDVRVRSENFDPVSVWRFRPLIQRERLLGNAARVAGLDLYIVAHK